jgi:hypothetical protein
MFKTKTFESIQITQNGIPINQSKISTEYDGKHLNIDGTINGHIIHKTMNQTDIIDALNKPASPLSLDDRLRKLFNYKNMNLKSNRREKSLARRTKSIRKNSIKNRNKRNKSNKKKTRKSHHL